MLRYIAAILLFFACTVFGRGRAWNMRTRYGLLTDLRFDIEQLKHRLEFTAKPIKLLIESITNFKRADVWQLLCIKMDNGVSMADAWRQAIAEIGEFKLLSAHESSIMQDYIGLLGTSDLTSQIKQAELTLLTLDQAIAELNRELAKKEKLYSSLGMLTGLAVAILVM